MLNNGRHRFERMNNICNHYYAMKWKDESKGFCCVNGQVVLASLSPAPDAIYKLLIERDPISNESHVKNIRSYNQVLAFTSIHADVDKELANAKRGVYTYRIQGELYHQIGGLMPKDDDKEPTFAQIYFYDANLDNQLQKRKEVFPDFNSKMLELLQNELTEINSFVCLFISKGKQVRDENISNMMIVIHNVHGKDMRQYNQPTAPEVAAILPEGELPNVRDIIIETH